VTTAGPREAELLEHEVAAVEAVLEHLKAIDLDYRGRYQAAATRLNRVLQGPLGRVGAAGARFYSARLDPEGRPTHVTWQEEA